MKTIITSLTIGILFLFVMAAKVAAHCEIPCGIYDDELRTNLIYEHTVTIEKSMKNIAELSKQNPVNYNQLIRWISNKEEHAHQRFRPLDQVGHTLGLHRMDSPYQSGGQTEPRADPRVMRLGQETRQPAAQHTKQCKRRQAVNNQVNQVKIG